MKAFKVAIVGVTGAVGKEMLSILEERDFPVGMLLPLASARSRGKKVVFCGEEIPIQVLEEANFSGLDIVLMSAGAGVSRGYAPKAAEEGCIVIDNSSAFRLEEDIPLIVPEVNPQALSGYRRRNIIANPNCTTIISVLPLKPLHDYAKIHRVIAASYQAVSGAGAQAMKDLEFQVKNYMEGKNIAAESTGQSFAFNLIPRIDNVLDNMYTREEMKLVWETRKILNDTSLRITATCVRVPVFRSHSVAMTVETEKYVSRNKALELFEDFPGLEVQDDPVHGIYPMPLYTSGMDSCFVGRVREDISGHNSTNLWVVGDQLRKGAALNAIQIAELIANEKK